MIIATWLSYIMARKRIGAPVPGIPAVQVGMISRVERWLHEVQDGTLRFLRWMLLGVVAPQVESTSAPPDPQQDVSLTAPLLLGDRTTAQLSSTSPMVHQATQMDPQMDTGVDTDAQVLLSGE
ncbi:spermatogenesis-associated protein 19, mitochondrial isoform X2 [Heliangelus exortis]|uniref:spermatogenesis-associated protein 19, mitochondrial isoform X2 n=1 Tax=Heliangelus exortis TaxID=472823 RepID=UPI003A90FEF8